MTQSGNLPKPLSQLLLLSSLSSLNLASLFFPFCTYCDDIDKPRTVRYSTVQFPEWRSGVWTAFKKNTCDSETKFYVVGIISYNLDRNIISLPLYLAGSWSDDGKDSMFIFFFSSIIQPCWVTHALQCNAVRCSAVLWCYVCYTIFRHVKSWSVFNILCIGVWVVCACFCPREKIRLMYRSVWQQKQQQ